MPRPTTERARLANALEEANERHEHERNSQRIRLDALQARVGATEKLLGEAREHLLARADEIRDYDRRLGDMALARDASQAKAAELEAERLRRDSEFEELRQQHSTLKERSAALARAFNAKDVELTRSGETAVALNARIQSLESEMTARQRDDRKGARGPDRRTPAREARTRGGRRRAGHRPQGFCPLDARGDDAAAQPDGARAWAKSVRRQRRLTRG